MSLLDILRDVSLSQDGRLVDLTLNDVLEHVTARNILLAKVIFSPEFDPADSNDLHYLWNVWYNAQWPESTRQRFLREVTELIHGKLPENVKIQKCQDVSSLTTVWESWFSTASSITPSILESLLKER